MTEMEALNHTYHGASSPHGPRPPLRTVGEGETGRGVACGARAPLSRAQGEGLGGRASTRRRLLVRGAVALALSAVLGQFGTAAAAPLACGVPPREPHPFAPPDPSVGWTTAPMESKTAITRAGR